MSIRKIIDWEISKRADIVGTIASEWYELYDDLYNQWTWACDVDIGEEDVLRGVPIATNNKDILYADIGKPVALTKMSTSGRYAITGLAKKIYGTTHIIYVTFEEDIGRITGEELTGFNIRPLTYEELYTYGGYGVVPYGCYGRFRADGTLIALIL